jgi:hypothetical protein
VIVDPPGIWQDRDSLVTLKAAPKPGFSFSGWEGSVTGSADSLQFAMDTSKTVTAIFSRANHPPVIAIPDTSFAEDDTLRIPFASLLLWISDPVDPVYLLTFHVEGTADHIHGSLDAGGLLFWADPDWNGQGWFAIQAEDPSGGSARDTVRYAVTPIDDPPGPFGIVSPAADFVYDDTTKSLGFTWHKSKNADAINEDSIRYAFYFEMQVNALDSVAAVTDTSFSWPHPEWLANGMYHWKVRAFDKAGNSVWSDSEGSFRVLIESGIGPNRGIPAEYRLSQNYPNPFNPSTGIAYALPERGHVRIEIFSSDGRKIRTLVDADRAPGEYAAEWDGADDTGRRAVSGVYLCRMTAGNFSRTVKMTVMK